MPALTAPLPAPFCLESYPSRLRCATDYRTVTSVLASPDRPPSCLEVLRADACVVCGCACATRPGGSACCHCPALYRFTQTDATLRVTHGCLTLDIEGTKYTHVHTHNTHPCRSARVQSGAGRVAAGRRRRARLTLAMSGPRLPPARLPASLLVPTPLRVTLPSCPANPVLPTLVCPAIMSVKRGCAVQGEASPSCATPLRCLLTTVWCACKYTCM